MSHGVGHKCRSDPMLLLLWLWPIWHLAWEPPYATGKTTKRQKIILTLILSKCDNRIFSEESDHNTLEPGATILTNSASDSMHNILNNLLLHNLYIILLYKIQLCVKFNL